MSQHMSMVASQTMRLEQRLTPQLIQSMEILQLPLLALEARVRTELESNPVLEDAEMPADEPSPSAEPAVEAPETPAATPEAESFDRLDRLSREYDFDPSDQPYARPAPSSGERDAKMDAMANSAARGPSLLEYLERQWALMDVNPDVRHAGIEVINWMNPDGYLRTRDEQKAPDDTKGNGSPALPLIIRRDTRGMEQLDDEIAHSVTPPLDPGLLEEAIARVQSMEPRGVGARDLTECLLIQLDAQPEHHELAELIVENHLDDIARNRLPNIAKATGKSIDEIKEALALIARLNHHPGSEVSAEQVPPIVPDIIVDYAEDGDGYTVRLARGGWQGLRISPHYRQMLEQGASGDGEARMFIRKNLDAAKALIDAIHYRRDRLLQIAKIVVDRQREFFDDGPRFLKVLRMRDIAHELDCDPSTISRTVDQKYIQTPRGIDPLRMFFTGGTETAEGQAISWDAVKQKVKEIIDAENKAEPLSDDLIVKKLTEGGHVNLSRRTVAKYRAQLSIPAARERKQF